MFSAWQKLKTKILALLLSYQGHKVNSVLAVENKQNVWWSPGLPQLQLTTLNLAFYLTRLNILLFYLTRLDYRIMPMNSQNCSKASKICHKCWSWAPMDIEWCICSWYSTSWSQVWFVWSTDSNLSWAWEKSLLYFWHVSIAFYATAILPFVTHCRIHHLISLRCIHSTSIRLVCVLSILSFFSQCQYQSF